VLRTLHAEGAQSSIYLLTKTTDKYRFPDELIPEDLYRVDYLVSRTTYSETAGLVAADMSKVYNPQDIDAFKSDIVKHFTWPGREPLPFMSFLGSISCCELGTETTMERLHNMSPFS
jgi:hypothetical protein